MIYAIHTCRKSNFTEKYRKLAEKSEIRDMKYEIRKKAKFEARIKAKYEIKRKYESII